MANNLRIIADYREFHSGIPTLLLNRKVETKLENLSAGDYLLNGQILAERKTSEDFVQSIISKRLFYQCKKMRKKSLGLLFIIEGNPYTQNTTSAVKPSGGQCYQFRRHGKYQLYFRRIKMKPPIF